MAEEREAEGEVVGGRAGGRAAAVPWKQRQPRKVSTPCPAWPCQQALELPAHLAALAPSMECLG